MLWESLVAVTRALHRTFLNGVVLRGNVEGPEMRWSKFRYVGGAEPRALA